ncbi:MAG: hypothetical protein AB7N71_00025 [Phycisphaerae bacterium]
MNDCPRCKRSVTASAKFCAYCGLSLTGAVAAQPDAGRMAHPEPLATPQGAEPWQQARCLYFKRQSAWGGTRLIGTEPIELTLFNAGYPLRDVRYEVRAVGKRGEPAYQGVLEIEQFPTGVEITVEIPSWELQDAVHSVAVRLLSAEFDWRPEDE